MVGLRITTVVIAVVMIAAVGRAAWLAVLSGRCVNLPVGEPWVPMAIVADKNFLGVNRASMSIAAHVDCVCGRAVSAAAVRASVGDGGGSQKGERTEGDGDDCFFHGCATFCYASFDPSAGRLFTILRKFFRFAAAAILKNELGIPTKQPIPISLFLGV